MSDPFAPQPMRRGPNWPNRFMLAPMTNKQSHDDGTLGDDEFRWLTMRASGGFGVTMTCGSHVREAGIGFPGQLGIWSDKHLEGLKRLADTLNSTETHSVVQLFHAGMRTPKALITGAPECPSDNEKYGARGLSTDEVESLKDDFVAAAKRAEHAGFHGVELHCAHGYLPCQFLSSRINQRTDQYGGSLENRARLIFDMVAQIRAECGPDFSLGVRLSPERFGMRLEEIKQVAQRLMQNGAIDYLDMSLWDVFKKPVDDPEGERSLLDHFTSLERGDVKLGAAGNIRSGADVLRAMSAGLDFVVIGRGGILHHDFPKRMQANPDFECTALPASAGYLRNEGLSDTFISYMRNWKGFVEAVETGS